MAPELELRAEMTGNGNEVVEILERLGRMTPCEEEKPGGGTTEVPMLEGGGPASGVSDITGSGMAPILKLGAEFADGREIEFVAAIVFRGVESVTMPSIPVTGAGGSGAPRLRSPLGVESTTLPSAAVTSTGVGNDPKIGVDIVTTPSAPVTGTGEGG